MVIAFAEGFERVQVEDHAVLVTAGTRVDERLSGGTLSAFSLGSRFVPDLIATVRCAARTAGFFRPAGML